jgi:hypothetical protein
MNIRRIIISVVAVFVIAACGSGDGDGEGPGTDDVASGTNATAEPSSGLVCESPPPAAMEFGAAVTGQNGSDRYTVCHVVEVPAGIGTMTIELTGLSDDLNVGVGFGDIETVQFNTGEYWSSSESGTADESVVIDDPAAGTYFIKIGPGTSKNTSAYTLTVSGS